MIRERLKLHGLVQGVGFRPHVFRLANELGLSGWVRNDAGGITLEVQGSMTALNTLHDRLSLEAPANARIDGFDAQTIPSEPHSVGFTIERSSEQAEQHGASIGPDSCTCLACLADLFDASNRRYRYAFVNCTDCGPRYSIAQTLPYDRARTSMAAFAQCPACLTEYKAPHNRRFHAEPNACPDCGPQLRLVDTHGRSIDGDPITETLARIERGEIIAIKGLGGFHLACDARNASAVAALRMRKHRDEKPLAVMLASRAALSDLAAVNDEELATLESSARPIVLLRKNAHTDAGLVGVAPGLSWLGVMLPYTPLHYLLFHEAAGRPDGTAWLDTPQPLALVMTSANAHGEPLVTDNSDALAKLGTIADAFLVHDRAIVIRSDDSVLRHLPGNSAPQFLRRARGYTPAAIPLGRPGPEVLALGGFYKNALCFTRSNQAFLSQHIGDLDRVANCRALDAVVDHLQHLLKVNPQAVAHDMHPDFYSTHLALRLAEHWQVPAIGVQHHHAHIAAVLAEHHLDEPVLGLALDGVGMGTDGMAWGGELLRVDGARFERLGHLRPIALPGGDKAAREPWRMGAAALVLLGRAGEIPIRFANEPGMSVVAQMLAQGSPATTTLSTTQTTSMGRWFDAAAGLLGILPRMSFEGQAAMQLEGFAERYGPIRLTSDLHTLTEEEEEGGLILDLSPVLHAMLSGTDRGHSAALFHAALVRALADFVQAAADTTGIRIVACGGGCFLNAVLTQGLRQALAERGLRMLEAQAAPPGDGGLALGQAWVAQRVIRSPDAAQRNPGQHSRTTPDLVQPSPDPDSALLHPGYVKTQDTSPCA